MKRRYSARLVLLGALTLAPLAVAEAGTVRGTVMNGTTGKGAAGIELTLIQLQGGMQEVAHSKSGAQGEFTFDHPSRHQFQPRRAAGHEHRSSGYL